MFQKIRFKEQLEQLLGEQTTTEFAEKTGFNRTYLSKYLNLRLDRPPSPDLLKSIAGSAVSYEELMVTCGHLPPDIHRPHTSVPIPVIGAIHAGKPVLAVENVESYEYVDAKEISTSHEYFYLRVEGDSMENARIYHGDLVFIRKQSYADSGDIAVVMIDDETATLKRFIQKNNHIILQPENPKYPPLLFPENEVSRLRIIGKVIHVKFKV